MSETHIPQQHEAVIITAAGGPEVLRLGTLPVPVPGPEEVLIKVAAAGVNRHDCNQRRAGPEHDPNPVPGLEVAGEIVALGSGVPRSRLGERVAALTQGGGYAQYVAAASPLALPWPPLLSPVEAAALPEALFTAWFNFFDVLRLQTGRTNPDPRRHERRRFLGDPGARPRSATRCSRPAGASASAPPRSVSGRGPRSTTTMPAWPLR